MTFNASSLFSFTEIAPVILLSTVLLAPQQHREVDSVDLEAVKASLVQSLNDTALLSNEDGRFVLPLRTNSELDTISRHCERIFLEADPSALVPPICGVDDGSTQDYGGQFTGAVYNQS